MFKVLTDAVENALDVAVNTTAIVATGGQYGNLPDKQQVSKLIADGLTVYAAAEVLGVTTDIVESIIGEEL